jgi:HAMP domain-containing protein
MNPSLKDRHLFGMGAVACAVCCAAPLLTLLGVAGAAATAATFVFAGVVFGLVVAAGALLAVWNQRRQRRRETCMTDVGPVDVALSARQPGHDA